MAKKKEADKAEKAERERARQEAQMAKAVKRARDAEAKKASGKGSAPADAAATNGEEPPAKRCVPLSMPNFVKLSGSTPVNAHQQIFKIIDAHPKDWP